jgi:hypothetical protein
MSKSRIQEIFSELTQICEQYKAEVPSHRRAWPMAVKSRVFELRSFGLRDPAIAMKTGLCYQTLRTWKESTTAIAPSFFPVEIKPQQLSRTPTVTVRDETPILKTKSTPQPIRRGRRPSPTMTVITPEGFKIEGIDRSTLLQLLGSRRT